MNKTFLPATVLATLTLLFTSVNTVAGASPAVAAPSEFQMPFQCGEVWRGATYVNHGSKYGHNTHYPLDLNSDNGNSWEYGHPVTASAAGTATIGSQFPGYGNYVEITHNAAGWKTLYGHLSSVSVANGQSVVAGQQIGTVGNSGLQYTAPDGSVHYYTGTANSHLHYEQVYNNSLQPISFNGGAITYNFQYNGTAYTSANCQPPPLPQDTDGDGVTDAAPDWCVLDKGTVNNRGCPNSVHQLSGDFNGDGKDDVVYVSRGPDNSPGLGWFRSTSTSTVTSVADPVGFSVALPAPAWNVDGLKWAAGDFNGDGKDDLLTVSGAGASGPGLYILLSDGTQFGNPQPVASPNPAYWHWWRLEWFAGDVDGDGKDDVLYSSRGLNNEPGLGWFKSTSLGGTASLASPTGFSVVLPAPAWNVDGLKWSVGDFNGDGKDDLLSVSGTAGSGPGLYLLTSTGSQLNNPVNVASPNPAYWLWDRLTFMVGNVDGDNRDDIIYVSRGPNNDPGLGWFPSTSTATTTSVGSPIAFSVVLPAPAWNVSGLKWAIVDHNGDGKDDILSVSGSGYSGVGIYLLTSNGSQLADPVNVNSPNPAYYQWARLQF